MSPAAPKGRQAFAVVGGADGSGGLVRGGGSDGVGVSVVGGGAWRSSKSADVACRSSVFVYKDRAEAKPSLYGRCPPKNSHCDFTKEIAMAIF